ncbi:polysaccharide pyruvyl transferase family protein [uncultured Roseobacter sp.]|uniref:polysaccharide pyruvyl transferase family protein n=1 Tax=uncultured Roseobacter sp. TaxID=114847 RepID=UPI0026211E95|nr:polysaccharide pyruvyl transferase family protein [uncultured Roseobacter sp.]
MSARLVHYKADSGNVGDDFSAWMFSRLLSQPLDDTSGTILFGVGSILDQRFVPDVPDSALKCCVFGSGARGPNKVPDISRGDWHIYCVRGPLTARALGVSCDLAVCDPGILAPVLYPAEKTSRGPIGIVPYFTASHALWSQVAEKTGCKIVSPHLGVEDFIHALLGCEKVFCESMHGAIFADAYGIPWCPLSATGAAGEGRTHAYKWTDWTASVGLGFDSIKLPNMASGGRPGLQQSLREKAKVTFVARRLKQAANADVFQVSDRALLAAHQSRLQTLATQMQDDLARDP